MKMMGKMNIIYIASTFVTDTMYPLYHKNMVIKRK
jgi:hypothetical protein